MVLLGEKLGGRHMDRSADVLEIVPRALFLKSSRVRPTLLGQRKRLPRTGTANKKHAGSIRRLVQKAYVSCVSDFCYSVCIDSNHRDSRI
jgi:hypothetical protein